MVHQHFMLIPVMTVAENIVLGSEPTRGGMLSTTRPRERSASSRDSSSFPIDPDARVDEITVGQQQRVEILKALYRGADILILDEPTAVLTPQEATELFEILRTLVHEGMSVIFISHKLNEVLEIADRITRPAARQEGRHGAARGRDRGGAGADDGRPRGAAARRKTAGLSG